LCERLFSLTGKLGIGSWVNVDAEKHQTIIVIAFGMRMNNRFFPVPAI
jgi:hypothetical protein